MMYTVQILIVIFFTSYFKYERVCLKIIQTQSYCISHDFMTRQILKQSHDIPHQKHGQRETLIYNGFRGTYPPTISLLISLFLY